MAYLRRKGLGQGENFTKWDHSVLRRTLPDGFEAVLSFRAMNAKHVTPIPKSKSEKISGSGFKTNGGSSATRERPRH